MALIPAERIPNGGWDLGVNTGVIGGIPNRTTIYDGNGSGITDSLTSIDNTGATDVAAAIQTACDAAGAGEVVRLPAGDFRCDAAINLPAGFNGKTLRGAGIGLTRLFFYSNQGIIAGSGSGYFTPTAGNEVIVTDGLEAGSTEITVTGDISYIASGSVIRLGFENQLDPLMYSVYAYDVNTNSSPHNQVVKVVSKVGQVLTFYPRLYCDHAGEEVRVSVQSFTTEAIGIEDMTVDMVNFGDETTGSYSGVSLLQCTGGWIKNVKSINAQNYGIVMADCVNCEIRGCWTGELKGSGSNGAGLLFSGWSCFVENNVMIDAFPGIEVNAGASANVFAYNFSNGQWNTNHAPHNRFNLDEGNAVNHQMSDGYFGSESDHTFLRCWFYNGNPNLRRFSRNFTFAGCLMLNEIGCGFPFISGGVAVGTAQLSAADPWREYEMAGELTTRTSDTEIQVTVTTGGILHYHASELHRVYLYWGTNNENVIIGNVLAWSDPVCTLNIINGTPPAEDTVFGMIGPGSYGGGGVSADATYPEEDLDVAATLVEKGNYRFDIEEMSSLGGDTLVDSLIYDSKPSFFGSLAWPPFDPTDPSTADSERIPAGYRFVNGEDPSGEITATTLNVSTLVVG